MTRIFASNLDLSRLPSPTFVNTDFETAYDERMAELKANLTAAGIPFDVEKLNNNSAALLQQEDNNREMLTKAAINDAIKRRMLAFATGSDLDHIAAFFGVVRLVGESDERLRRRVQVAPDAYTTTGSYGSYIYNALSADVRLMDVQAISTPSPYANPGDVIVVLLSPPEVRDEVFENVRSVLMNKDIKSLTVNLILRNAQEVPYSIVGKIYLPSGPDPTRVTADAKAQVITYQSSVYKIGQAPKISGIIGALQRPAAIRVEVLDPLSEIQVTPLQIAVPVADPMVTFDNTSYGD
jgi:phage-related baseplate assembly protein